MDSAYKKIVSKGPLPYVYMRVRLEFDERHEMDINSVEFKAILLQSLKDLHGEVVKSIQADIMKYNPKKKEAILRVPHDGHVKLWSALTCFGKYSDVDCAFRVLQTCGNLMGLATNSRENFLKFDTEDVEER